MAFFTTPGSTKKRKRAESHGPSGSASKKKNTSTAATTSRARRRKKIEDEEISSEEDDVEDRGGPMSDGEDEDEELANETAADKRRRLALQYLDQQKAEINEAGFDAQDVDRDILAQRLKESVAEDKGKIYRHLAESLSFSTASHTVFRADTKTTTGIALCYPHIYTISKDRHLIKWTIPEPSSNAIKPKQTLHTRSVSRKNDAEYEGGHVDEIITIAASQDGRFVATGGKDKRIVVWDPETLKPLKIFKQHRSPVMGLVFRRNTNQLYSCSADRTVKLWSLDELAYVETLFGHQDEVVGITALASERCVTVGSRDRTARLWKIVEETQLVFRGGGEGSKKNKSAKEHFMEGSIDSVALVDEEHFVTGSDNGSISFWSVNKKKPIFTVPVAHGKPPPLPGSSYTAETDTTCIVPPPPQPRPITALVAVPYSDTFFSGSYDGHVRVWKVSQDKRAIESVGILGVSSEQPQGGSNQGTEIAKGVVNGISVCETGEKGKETLYVTVALGKEMRLGRWLTVPGKNGAVLYRLGKKAVEKSREAGAEDGGSGLVLMSS